MRISELSRQSGVSVYRLRHYESLGLIKAERSPSGYRHFADRTLREVIFIAMSRDLGFSLKAIAETVPRYRAGTLTFEQMIDLIQGRVADVDQQMAALANNRRKLVEHAAWLEQRQREAEAGRKQPKTAAWGRTAPLKPMKAAK